MQAPSAKEAYAKTMSQVLDVDPDLVIILAVDVYRSTERRLEASSLLATIAENSERRLAAGDLVVNVTYQVSLVATADAPAPTLESISAKIRKTGDAGSDEGAAFTSTLIVELKTAAARDSSGSASLLGTIAQSVETEGITVKGIMDPVMTVIQVPLTTTTTWADQSAAQKKDEKKVRTTAMLVMNILAALGGVLCAIICGLIVWKLVNRKRSHLMRVMAMADVQDNRREPARPPPMQDAWASPPAERAVDQSSRGEEGRHGQVAAGVPVSQAMRLESFANLPA
jgi:hypothetical protein